MTIECTFGYQEKVLIKEIQQIGRVKSVWWCSRGVEYEVRYFQDGKVHTEYFFEDELEEVKK